MFELFTGDARQVVVEAQRQAVALEHRLIGTEHLLLALLACETTIPAAILKDAGMSLPRLHKVLSERWEAGCGPVDPDDEALVRAIGIDLSRVRASIDASFGRGALASSGSPVRAPGPLGCRHRHDLVLSEGQEGSGALAAPSVEPEASTHRSRAHPSQSSPGGKGIGGSGPGRRGRRPPRPAPTTSPRHGQGCLTRRNWTRAADSSYKLLRRG